MSDDLPVKVEVGAKFEVKTTIPEEATGRLAHAVADAVSPLTEWLGFQGDRIRIHRMQVVRKLIQEADKIPIDEAKRCPIPLKIAVRLLEHASQEEIDDDYMISRWAHLLASAATTDGISPRFVSLLNEINGRQARLLDQISWSSSLLGYVGNSSQQSIQRKVIEAIATVQSADRARSQIASILSNAGGVRVSYVHISEHDDDWHRVEYAATAEEADLEILTSLGLLDDVSFLERITLSRSNSQRTIGLLAVRYHRVTSLGYALLRAVGSRT